MSLESYRQQILKQSIGDERVDRDTINQSFSDLVIPDDFIRRIGPGINSGKCILLYGPAGNGKTSVAEKVGKIFKNIVFIPYAVEVDGQIIKVFDPTIHEPIEAPKPGEARTRGLRKESFDNRWVPCKRPIIIAGGELTLEMLDLKFNALAKFYEAPLHVKALGGTFIIDDFGRQLVKPEDILNRWIVPLQSRVDYLKLHTGKSFQVPFDELVIFSTNMAPNDLMDPAFLRRIPYKLKTENPSLADYRLIFEAVARKQGLDLEEEIFDYVVDELQGGGHTLACYQPGFIVEQVVSVCKYEGQPPMFTRDYVADALANLYAKESDEDREMSKLSQIKGSNSGISDAA